MQHSELSCSGTPRSRAEVVERGIGHPHCPSAAIVYIIIMPRKSKANNAVK